MTKFFLLAILFLATNAFGQETPVLNQVSKPLSPGETINPKDAAFRVLYPNKNSNSHSKKPAFYFNGRLVNEEFIFSLNPNVIESVDVLKDAVLINNVTYYGRMYVKTKDSYNPKLVSLTELKSKYLKSNNLPTVFIFDGELITSDYDTYVVDENNLLRIIIDKVENKKEGINLNHIKLLTKTEENIRKVNATRIRGTEMTMRK